MKIEKENIEEKVIQSLNTIKDLELPISIYDLGLIYKIDVENECDNINVNIETTVINSRCNSIQSFSDTIINTVKTIEEVDNCNVKFVYTPKWDVSMITQRGLKHLKSIN